MMPRLRPDKSDPVVAMSFGPTSGTFSGWFGIAFAGLLVVLSAWGGLVRDEWRVVACACLGAVVCWILMLRPRVVFEPSAVVLRNLVTDTTIPYARLDSLVVRSVTCAFVDGRRYVGIGVGRSRTSMTRKPRRGGRGTGYYGSRLPAETTTAPVGGRITNDQVPDLVEDQARDRVTMARRDRIEDDLPVRRTPAVLEIAALVLTIAGVVVSFVL